MKRLEARVSGLVQGVFFRAFTREQARRLGLSGWVANRPDGSVELAAEGDETALQEFVKALQNGPERAQVDQIECRWLEATGQESFFTIQY